MAAPHRRRKSAAHPSNRGKRRYSRREALDALRKETDRAVGEQIRVLLALPMNKRTHFLRVRLPGGGTGL
jgi:hypothetical protein